MIGAAALALAVSLRPDPCAEEPRVLAAEAERILREGSGEEHLAAARDLYRRARLQEPSAELTARGADLAVAAGDPDEAVRLLSDLAREAPELLTVRDRLLLADAAEARGDRRGAIFQLGHVLTAMARRGEAPPTAVGARIRRLDAEEEAGLVPVRAYAPPSFAAQEAFADGKRLAASGRTAEAEERFRLAIRSAPGYVEPALALGALLTRAGRAPEAIAAYRTALAAEPERFEAVLSLANLLWAEPDRAAKEESLALLDRAAVLRPDLPHLLRDAATRWAAWGDAPRALERLDAFRRLADPAERSATEGLRSLLAASVRSAGAAPAPAPAQLSSPAERSYRLAQVYVLRRGDDAALAAGKDLLDEALRLDPSFAPAWDLLATLHEKRGDARATEEALRKAIAADPARAAAWERLAELLTRDPARGTDALSAWRSAERAGSREAIVHLAEAALGSGDRSGAADLYRRYLVEAPDGARADEARDALARMAVRERWRRDGALVLAGLLFVAGGAWGIRRFGGDTLSSWLAREPDEALGLRPHVGRLRHELFKHGRFLLLEAATRLSDAAARPETARLLLDRLFGEGSEAGGGPDVRRGLVPEARRELDAIRAAARARGVRLNLAGKDPELSAVAAALAELSVARRDLRRVADGAGSPRRLARLARHLGAASAHLSPETAQRLGTLLHRAGSTPFSRADLERLLAEASSAARLGRVPLETTGASDTETLLVRVVRADWETIWRNLFANALAAGAATRPDVAPRLLLHVERVRDPVTGEGAARFLLADDVPRPLTAEMIRGRAAERGLGIVADLVRRHEGIVDVVAPPVPGYEKAVLVELPALEES